MAPVVCPTAYPFAHTSLFANGRRNESLVWFKAFGFGYTINMGSPKGLLLAILLLPFVTEILQVGF